MAPDVSGLDLGEHLVVVFVVVALLKKILSASVHKQQKTRVPAYWISVSQCGCVLGHAQALVEMECPFRNGVLLVEWGRSLLIASIKRKTLSYGILTMGKAAKTCEIAADVVELYFQSRYFVNHP